MLAAARWTNFMPNLVVAAKYLKLFKIFFRLLALTNSSFNQSQKAPKGNNIRVYTSYKKKLNYPQSLHMLSLMSFLTTDSKKMFFHNIDDKHSQMQNKLIDYKVVTAIMSPLPPKLLISVTFSFVH